MTVNKFVSVATTYIFERKREREKREKQRKRETEKQRKRETEKERKEKLEIKKLEKLEEKKKKKEPYWQHFDGQTFHLDVFQ